MAINHMSNPVKLMKFLSKIYYRENSQYFLFLCSK